MNVIDVGTPRRFRRATVVLDNFRLGGSERQAILLARYLKEACGVSVEVIGFQSPGTASQLMDEWSIPWRIVPFKWEPGRLRRLGMLLRVARSIREAAPDVILPYIMKPNVVCGLIWKLTGARLCMWNQRDEGRQRVEPRWERLAVKGTPWFASNSQHGAEFVVETLGAPRERIRIIHNGVQLSPKQRDRSTWRQSLGISEQAFVATMVANLHAYKDHATLLDAWRLVIDTYAKHGGEVVLLLAGRFENTAVQLKAQAFDLGLGCSVRFLGAVADVTGLMLASDLCVFSSRFEGVPNGVLEGMAAGLPVVATDIPGIREAVGDSGCAILTPPGDAQAMASAIQSVIEDRGLALRMGEAGRERIRQEFAPEKMVRETVEWIEQGLEYYGR